MTSESLILVHFIGEGKICASCFGACALLHSSIAILFLKISQGAFSLGMSGRAPVRQEDCCGKLPSVCLCSLKCHLSLDSSSCGSWSLGSVRHSSG